MGTDTDTTPDLRGLTQDEVLRLARNLYLPHGRGSYWLDGVAYDALANKLEADALSIARWEVDEEGHFRVPASARAGDLLNFAQRVRAKAENGD